MGFFNKIFGEDKENSGSSQKIRAQYKDINYFNKEIERIDLWMKDDEEDFQVYKEKNGKLENHHYIEACNIRLQKIQNIYSKGEKIEVLSPVLDEALGFLFQADPKEFTDNSLFLKCCSLLVLLKKQQEYKSEIQNFISVWQKESTASEFKPIPLLYFIMEATNDSTSTNDYPPFILLENITSLSTKEAEEAVKKYLEDWYNLHQEDAWYNSHLRDWGYSGYWAWEVGAVVKRMGLNDNSFKDNPYYPYDMVHWK
ncbi:MAG: DUF1911 domain-containing protein [Chryseobacterium sp.]|uniref:PoNe immunity protein domain-containing protein n=1 Tax=Chryseobacterium sp. TaxID=1871047 RepID=UPI0025BFB573|nr:PoNe immunity protein domain-containing protein [Chryseobacterium sp.]MCJ7935641.1 DUF1911 domain-containing protein [Chryseobacterium sp.]